MTPMFTTTTKRIGSKLLSPALLLVLAAAPPLHAMIFAPAPVPAAAPGDTSAYATGTRAMNERRWKDAIAAFDKVVAAKDQRSDAALYWKAYSLNKLQRYPDTTAVCNALRAQYAGSSWNKDCAALSISARDVQINLDDLDAKIRQNIKVHVDPIVVPDINVGLQDNSDIKILALNSLMHQDPAKAIPILRGILNGNQSEGMKKHAIFVLAQSKSPEAQSILHDAVTGKMDPELQRQAITMMAIFEGKRANDTLAEVYRTSTDPNVKKSIISAFFITQDAPRMVALARNEKNLDLKRSIVSQLALMHDKAATDYMLELLK
jgi:HEAT repeat protein